MSNRAIIPPKLQPGDEIRVIAPSRSFSIISNEVRKVALDRLEAKGYKITYGKHLEETDDFLSSSVDARIADLHDAFLNPSVKGIFTAIGGYNSNQLLGYIDYDLIKANPKVLVGFSDITVLSNAIYRKTGLITYSGPHFSSWGMVQGFEYTQENFEKAVEQNKPYDLKPSTTWSDDPWYLNQTKREHIANSGGKIWSNGEAEGVLIGGNMSSLSLLQGTEYWPDLGNKIIFLEDDDETSVEQFNRYLQSMVHQQDLGAIKALLLGRFQKTTNMTDKLLGEILLSKGLPPNIPVISNLDFGHTTPIATLPVGGKIKVVAKNNKYAIKILNH